MLRSCIPVLLVLCLFGQVTSRALKVFLKGYNSRNLLPGGWTQWFNIDHPGGAGDFETYTNIVRLYGRTCMGIPCRRPLAIKAISIYGQTPNANGDRVTVHPRDGLKCHSSHQYTFRCQDYKVRFYCHNLHTKCSDSRFYPQHHRNSNNNQANSTSSHQDPTNDIRQGQDETQHRKHLQKIKKKLLKLQTKQTTILEDNDVHKPKRTRILRLRAKSKSRDARMQAMTKATVITQSTPIVNQPTRARLTYHPRHPLYT